MSPIPSRPGRALTAALLLVTLGCGNKAPITRQPPPDATPPVADVTPIMDSGAPTTATVVSPDVVAATDAPAVGEVTEPVDVAGPADAAAEVKAVPSAIAVASGASPGLSLEGLPGVSADGMHVAVVVGVTAGPLLMRIARIDGSTLLEHELVAGEAKSEAQSRQLARRAATAQKVLTEAGMRALTPMPTGAGGRALVESGERLSLSLRGFASQSHPASVLDRSMPGCPKNRHRRCPSERCRMPHRLLGVYADTEHGLVVAHVEHAATADCPAPQDRDGPFIADDWRVFALVPLP